MYHDFFGLREAPFRITPNTDFFFAGGNRGAILDALLYAISQGEGIVKVTGEVGSGKTMLCRMLQARLPENVTGLYLANPSVSPEEVLHAIVHELELTLPIRSSRLEAMQRLTSYLLDCHAAGRQVVLFVEESQSVPVATLEEIRLLSNLETDRHKLLQIVLFGQPELDALLRRPEIRQLRERITHGFDLAPLATDDTGLYLNFRMRAAGYRGPDVFGPAVVKRIARASAGLTRRVNLLADKTLLAAFAENTHALAPRHVRAAIRDSEFARGDGPAGGRRRLPLLIGGATAAALLAATLAWVALQPASDARLVPATGAPPAATPGAAPAPAPAPPTGTQPVAAPVEGSAPAAAPATAPAQAGEPSPAPAPGTERAPPAAALTAPAATAALAAGASEAASGNGAAASGAVAAPAGAATSLLQARLAATHEWLLNAPPTTVSIQLMGSRSEAQLDQHLRSLARQVDPERLFVFRTQAGDRPSMTVLYGAYVSRDDAQTALATLPQAIRGFSPRLRTVQGVRNEIAAPGS